MYAVKTASTAQPLLFLMVQSADHLSPATGLSPTVVLSKAGGSFAGPAGAVSEIGDGWYAVAGNATDTGTLGPLLLHATASGADPTDAVFQVVAYDPLSATNLGLANLDAAVSSRSTFAGGAVASVTGNVGGNVAGSVGSVTGAVMSVTTPVTVGTNNDKAGYSLSVTPPTAAAIATAVWTDTTAGDFTTTGSPGKTLVGQLAGTFTTSTSSVFGTAALANAPSGGGGSGPLTGEVTAASSATSFTMDLGQTVTAANLVGKQVCWLPDSANTPAEPTIAAAVHAGGTTYTLTVTYASTESGTTPTVGDAAVIY